MEAKSARSADEVLQKPKWNLIGTKERLKRSARSIIPIWRTLIGNELACRI
jgi:hypothetical protein